MKTNNFIFIIFIFTTINAHAQTPKELYLVAMSKYSAGEHLKAASMLTKYLTLVNIGDKNRSQIEAVIKWCKVYSTPISTFEAKGIIKNNNRGLGIPLLPAIPLDSKPKLPEIY
jgi:hypothetical protein|tara:strand:- start:1175 stop:1516 length:342 start_codon:yes stop_codon:yes gene_type:complete